MASSLLRQDVLPVAVGYLLLMGALAAGLRLLRRDSGPAGAGREGAPGSAPGRPGPPEIPGPPGIPRPAGTPGPAGIPGPPAAGWIRLARRYAGTALGGYLLLMAVVILYYYGVARVGGPFIASAFTGCALLIALTTPVFALASWLDVRRRARPGRKARG
jgi:Family of unknown function (DUF6256)